MQTLRSYLKSLNPDQQDAYARRCGTSLGYLRKALSKGQRFDGALARLLWDHSHGQVSRHELRPDIWPTSEHDVWPEVIGSAEAA